VDWHSPRDWLRVIARSTKRIAVLVIGSVLVLAGLAMLVLPGPGLLVIVAGLAVLASEFAWAEHLLDRAQAQAAKAAERAKRTWRARRGLPADAPVEAVAVEGGLDLDGDGIADALDLDHDGVVDVLDLDHDGVPDVFLDGDGRDGRGVDEGAGEGAGSSRA
jgi:uncharacterized protein (TIGR02611 family)